MNGTAQMVAIAFCGLLAIATVITSCIIIATGHEVPGALWALGGASGGALAAYITPYKTGGWQNGGH